jgi:hypothetical protein
MGTDLMPLRGEGGGRRHDEVVAATVVKVNEGCCGGESEPGGRLACEVDEIVVAGFVPQAAAGARWGSTVSSSGDECGAVPSWIGLEPLDLQ